MADNAAKTSVNRLPDQLFLGVASAFLVANLILPGLPGFHRSRFNLFGNVVIEEAFLASEGALVAIWAVYGTGPVARRAVGTIALCILGWFTYLTGACLAPQSLRLWEELGWSSLMLGSIHPTVLFSDGVLLAVLEILFVAVFTAATWIYRSATKQVLYFRNQPSLKAPPFQFSTRHVLCWTVFVALGIVWTGQIFDPLSSFQFWYRPMPRIETMLVCPILSAFLMLACIEVTLGQRSRRVWFAAGLMAIPILALVGIQILEALQLEIVNQKPRIGGPNAIKQMMQFISFVSIFFAVFEAMTTLVLIGVRWMGFRLVSSATSLA